MNHKFITIRLLLEITLMVLKVLILILTILLQIKALQGFKIFIGYARVWESTFKLIFNLQNREESLLRHVDRADLLHSLFTFFLFF